MGPVVLSSLVSFKQLGRTSSEGECLTFIEDSKGITGKKSEEMCFEKKERNVCEKEVLKHTPKKGREKTWPAHSVAH